MKLKSSKNFEDDEDEVEKDDNDNVENNGEDEKYKKSTTTVNPDYVDEEVKLPVSEAIRLWGNKINELIKTAPEYEQTNYISHYELKRRMMIFLGSLIYPPNPEYVYISSGGGGSTFNPSWWMDPPNIQER